MKIDLEIIKQPANECLPTALHSVLEHNKINVDLKKIIEDISIDCTKLHDWFFRAGSFVLKQGKKVSIRTLATNIFDPSWRDLDSYELKEKLTDELRYFKTVEKVGENHIEFTGAPYNNSLLTQIQRTAVEQALIYLEKDGKLDLKPISLDFFSESLSSNKPIIFSHNAPLLHGLTRAFNNDPDEIKGQSWGHVAIISGIDEEKNLLHITDPAGDFYENAMHYWIDADLVLESILRYNGDTLIIG